jgi:hypothetical protein
MSVKISRHVLMAKLAIGVILLAAKDHRPAGRATGGGAAGLREANGRGGEFIKIWRSAVWVAIRAELEPKIVGHDQHHVFIGPGSLQTGGTKGNEGQREQVKAVCFHEAHRADLILVELLVPQSAGGLITEFYSERAQFAWGKRGKSLPDSTDNGFG